MDAEVLFEEGRELSVLEMGHSDLNVSCTNGKIVLWFGRQVNESSIWQVIFGISNIDSSINHEQEIICEFNDIAEYENKGYVLTSYAKTKGGYRAIFYLPFSKKYALAHFVESIVNQLKESDVKKILHWDGSPATMIMMYNELRKSGGWNIKRIIYKDEEASGVNNDRRK